MFKSGLVFCIISIPLFLSGCVKDSEEDKLGGYGFCKESQVSFSENVQPILNQDCVSCHTGPGAENGVVLDSYSGVVASVNDGLFMPVIKQDAGYIPMPTGKPKLNDCKIATLQKWIDEGMVNN